MSALKDPIIFRGLKSLTLANSQQSSLLRLAAEGISVYCPHTALDTQAGGINDWLAGLVIGLPLASSSFPNRPGNLLFGHEPIDPNKYNNQTLYHFASLQKSMDRKDISPDFKYTVRPITPFNSHPKQFDPATTGTGRIISFSPPQTLTSIMNRIHLCLGKPKGFDLAVPKGEDYRHMKISNMGICAGSGGSVFASIGDEDKVDLLLTGELSHHEALAATEKGQYVISLRHSVSERGFLKDVLQGQLEEEIRKEWSAKDGVEMEEEMTEDIKKYLGDMVKDKDVEVLISQEDRDPYGLLIFD